MNCVTVVRDANDRPRRLRIIIHFHHRLMQGRVKAFAERIDLADTEPLERLLQYSMGRPYSLDQSSVFNRFGLVTFGSGNGALQIVGYRQNFACKI